MSMLGDMMFGKGSWWVQSKTNPRWNGSGSTKSLLFSGGPPPEALKHIEKKKRKLGDPPDDLEWGGLKD